MIVNQEVINRAVEYIKEKLLPDKIYLFGSYAKGNPTPNSDLDFFIIKDTNLPKPQRTVPLYSIEKTKRIGVPIGVDFVVYTPEECETMKAEPNSIVGEVLRTGKLLYERRPIS